MLFKCKNTFILFFGTMFFLKISLSKKHIHLFFCTMLFLINTTAQGHCMIFKYNKELKPKYTGLIINFIEI